jgi:hypothetical protein
MTQKNNLHFSTFSELINSVEDEWKIVIKNGRETLAHNFLNDRDLIMLYEKSSHPEILTCILRLLYQDSKERPIGVTGFKYLLKMVDGSKFNLEEWITTLSVFESHLQKKNRRSPFLKMLGFLQCCEEAPENKLIKQDFCILLNEMLEQFGYIG